MEAHLQNGVCLFFGEFKSGGEFEVGVVLIGALLDDADDFVDIGKRQNEPLHDVGAFLRLGEVELRAADDDFLLVLQVIIENVAQRQVSGLGAVLDEGK